MRNRCSVGKDESGMALIVSLLTLVSLTAIGFMAVYNATVETSISGNERKASQALMYAGAGIEHARRALLSQYPWDGSPAHGADVLNSGVDTNGDGIKEVNIDGGATDYQVVVSDPLPTIPEQIKVLSTGYGPNNSVRKIEAWLRYRDPDAAGSYAMAGSNEHNDGVSD